MDEAEEVVPGRGLAEHDVPLEARRDCLPAVLLAAARRLDRGVEREQVGALGDGRDQLDHLAHLAGAFGQLGDGLVGVDRRAARLAGQLGAAFVVLGASQAQAQGRFQRTPATRGFISANGIYQATGSSFTDDFEFQEFVEKGTIEERIVAVYNQVVSAYDLTD